MPTVTVPDYVPAQNYVSVFFLPTIASQAAPTVAEFTAGVDITPFLPVDWAGITGDQAKGSQTRMALPESFEILGRITRSISEFVYTYLPQAAGSDPANKVYTAMAAGSAGYIAVRYGVPTSTSIAATQKVESIKVITGVQNKQTTGTDEFAPLTVTQSVSAQAVPVAGVVA